MLTEKKKVRERKKGEYPRHKRERGKLHKREVLRIKPSADPRLKKIFSKIGVPPQTPFIPDPFQVEAIETIRWTDCLVSAPTGSGKTWIAMEAICRIYNQGGKAWYASPLKALSNSKYHEFQERFGAEHVGILTGDRRENGDAPIIVGTTEILRNHLYDSMHSGLDLSADLVILDEAHFLGDRDRGVVWEEIMIYLPVSIHLLLLSATIRNAREIADWLESIRSKTCVVVEEKGRPVPLFPLFFHPSGRILPLITSKGIDDTVESYMASSRPPVLAPPGKLPPFRAVLRVLEKYDLLPAIFFMKSRADCDAALEGCANGSSQSSADKAELMKSIDEMISEHPHLASHRQLWSLKNVAVAAHHSGQLPAWKLVVEYLMNQGLLDAVFATSTVAAGVNFPARSVVFLNSDLYNGHEFVPLNATEFHQMTGRAGRRGKDNIGFAVIIPGKFMDVELISYLLASPPEDVLSQIKVDFSMVMNLLLSHGLEEAREIFQRSFAIYLNLIKQKPGLNQQLIKTGQRLMAFLPKALCGGSDSVMDLTKRRSILLHEASHLKRKVKLLESKLFKSVQLVKGRLFADHHGRIYAVIKPQVRRSRQGILARRIKEGGPRRAKGTKTKWLRLDKVSQVLDRFAGSLPKDDGGRGKEPNPGVEKPQDVNASESLLSNEKESSELKGLKSRLLLIEQEIEVLLCTKCDHFKVCHMAKRDPFNRVRDEFALNWDTANAIRRQLWNTFMKHLDFLKVEGFVTEDNRLTKDGIWASQLRLDLPLMIAESLRKNLFPDDDPGLFAALIAPFVHDRETETVLNESSVPKKILSGYERMIAALSPLIERKIAWGFEARPVFLWPAAAVYGWAHGESWERVLEIAGIAEGDLAMLILRTADNLRQIASLTKVYPSYAQSAFDAIAMILREPVVVN